MITQLAIILSVGISYQSFATNISSEENWTSEKKKLVGGQATSFQGSSNKTWCHIYPGYTVHTQESKNKNGENVYIYIRKKFGPEILPSFCNLSKDQPILIRENHTAEYFWGLDSDHLVIEKGAGSNREYSSYSISTQRLALSLKSDYIVHENRLINKECILDDNRVQNLSMRPACPKKSAQQTWDGYTEIFKGECILFGGSILVQNVKCILVNREPDSFHSSSWTPLKKDFIGEKQVSFSGGVGKPTCHIYPKYIIHEVGHQHEVGSDIFVYARKDNGEASQSLCNQSKKQAVLIIRNEFAEYFHGLYDDFIFLDSGTSHDRAFIVYSISQKSKKLTHDQGFDISGVQLINEECKLTEDEIKSLSSKPACPQKTEKERGYGYQETIRARCVVSMKDFSLKIDNSRCVIEFHE